LNELHECVAGFEVIKCTPFHASWGAPHEWTLLEANNDCTVCVDSDGDCIFINFEVLMNLRKGKFYEIDDLF